MRRATRIHYRRLDDRGDPLRGESLEQAMRRSLAAERDGVALSGDWSRRCRQDPDDPQDRLFINHLRDSGNFLFWNLVSFTQGRQQAMLEEVGNVPEVPIETFDAPAGRQFMNGMLFCLVTGNHVFIVQDSRVRAHHAEFYLHWLLGEQSGVVASPFEIVLLDRFDRAAVGDDFGDVQSVSIGGAVAQVHVPQVDPAGGRDVRQTRIQRLGEIAREDWKIEVLERVLGGAEQVERILERLDDDAELTVQVQLGITTTRRRVNREALRDVQRAARNLPDSDLKIVGKHGVLTGDQARLSYPANVLSAEDLLDRDDVLRAIIEAYRAFVMNGKIEATALPPQ
ncbi:MAG: hypothetical protein JWL84_2649 [Rhodospirillales bacterium]|nr:hypothetical protein [Rhodospirillales bacterium]